jgi:signal transduction histidine kinase
VEIVTLPAGSQPSAVRAQETAPEPSGELSPKGRRRPAARPDRSQHAASTILAAVSTYLDADEQLETFFERLSETIAGLVGARRAAFWRLGPRDVLALQPNAFGFPTGSPIDRVRLEPAADRGGVLGGIASHGRLQLVGGTSPELDAIWRHHGIAGITSSIAVAWKAGERRLGLIAAYDSRRGFTVDDLWVLNVASMASGLIWQYKESEDELGATAVRLEEAVAARKRLMNNIGSGGDEARRRFASVLNEDSLQLLTAAEFQVERIRAEASGSHQAVQLDHLRVTLSKVEDSLRDLLGHVSPEVQVEADLQEAISERLENVRIQSGIEAYSDLLLPEELPEAIQAIVLKNITEALANVERHANATRVMVSAQPHDDGVRVEIADDGAGFVVAESTLGHLGLIAIKERAQLAGGWCRISSEPGAGATIEFWVPGSL